MFVIHQYPSCGFNIDLVCEKDGVRVAVECDGERFHLDEHGQPKLRILNVKTSFGGRDGESFASRTDGGLRIRIERWIRFSALCKSG